MLITKVPECVFRNVNNVNMRLYRYIFCKQNSKNRRNQKISTSIVQLMVWRFFFMVLQASVSSVTTNSRDMQTSAVVDLLVVVVVQMWLIVRSKIKVEFGIVDFWRSILTFLTIFVIVATCFGGL